MEARQTINLVSGDLLRRDPSTVYDVANGARTFPLKMSKRTPIAIQAVWTSLNKVDGSLKVYGSNDGVNYDLVDVTTAVKDLDSASDSWSFIKDFFNWEYISVEYVQPTGATGTIKLTLEIK